MDKWNLDKMTPFDCRLANQTLQMTKLIIPYLPPNTQQTMAIYVRFMEFQNAMSSFRTFKQSPHSTMDIFDELRPYIPPSACESIDNIMNMVNMVELFKEFQNQSEWTDGGNPFGDMNSFDPMAMMMSMFSPEQQDIFDMYNNMFSSQMNNEGGEKND